MKAYVIFQDNGNKYYALANTILVATLQIQRWLNKFGEESPIIEVREIDDVPEHANAYMVNNQWQLRSNL